MKKFVAVFCTVLYCPIFYCSAQDSISLGDGWHAVKEDSPGFGNSVIGNITFYLVNSGKNENDICTFAYNIIDGYPESISVTWSKMRTVKTPMQVEMQYISDGHIYKSDIVTMHPGTGGELRTVKLYSEDPAFDDFITWISKGNGYTVSIIYGNHTVEISAPETGFTL